MGDDHGIMMHFEILNFELRKIHILFWSSVADIFVAG